VAQGGNAYADLTVENHHRMHPRPLTEGGLDGRVLVVGAAVVRDGRLLAARRTTPPAAAGRWELPGGKVDPGETPDSALMRELAEELGCRVEVEWWLDGEEPIGDTHVLRAAVCRLVDDEPAAGPDHDELRWLGAATLDDVSWLDPDRPFLPALREVLLGSGA
jgi:8-oxo-dGTP diphosphatase